MYIYENNYLVRWLVVSSVVVQRSSGFERILEPLHAASIHQYGIETARRDMREAGEILLRGEDDAPLFARVDAGRRTAEIGAAPQAHLDEYQGCAVPHDQIDLAKAAAIILRNRLQPLLPQVLRSLLLGLRAVVHGFTAGWSGNTCGAGAACALRSCAC